MNSNDSDDLYIIILYNIISLYARERTPFSARPEPEVLREYYKNSLENYYMG